jgi:hypothetical protein
MGFSGSGTLMAANESLKLFLYTNNGILIDISRLCIFLNYRNFIQESLNTRFEDEAPVSDQ